MADIPRQTARDAMFIIRAETVFLYCLCPCILRAKNKAIFTRDEIKKCETDESARLELISSKTIESLPPRKKDTKYTPLSLRQEKPFAILWLIKRYPSELSSSQIAKLTGSTKNTVEAISNGTYREAVLESKSPMDTGLCSYQDLEKALNRAKNKKDKAELKSEGEVN